MYGKTHIAFSTDPSNKCAPEGHNIQIREIRLSAGAEFIVAIAGDIMTNALLELQLMKSALVTMEILKVYSSKD